MASRQLPAREQESAQRDFAWPAAALKQPLPDIEADVEKQFQKAPNKDSLSPEATDRGAGPASGSNQGLLPGGPANRARRWTIDLGLQKHLLRDQPLFLRVKFHTAQTNLTGTYLGYWQVDRPRSARARSLPQSLAADTYS